MLWLQMTLIVFLAGPAVPAAQNEDTLSEMKEMVMDKEHLQEEFDNMFTKQDMRQMSTEEMAFAWFSAHDTDADVMLDGTEMYKAIYHSRGHKSGNHDHPTEAAVTEVIDLPPGVPPTPTVSDFVQLGTEDRGAIAFVDQLLMQFDSDNDGRLDYAEYVKSFHQ